MFLPGLTPGRKDVIFFSYLFTNWFNIKIDKLIGLIIKICIMEKRNRIKRFIVTAISHVACMALIFAVAFFLGWLWPITKPYDFFFAAVISFFFGAMWDGENFGLGPRNILTFLAGAVILLVAFVFSGVCHIFSWDIIPGIWHSLALWPSLIGFVLSFVWFLFFMEYFDQYDSRTAARYGSRIPD